MPPCELSGFTLVIEAILSTWQSVEIDNDVHALRDGVLRDPSQRKQLATRVVVHTFLAEHERPVADGNAESVHAISGEIIDILRGDVGPVTFFEQESALQGSENLTKGVLVLSSRGAIVIEE